MDALELAAQIVAAHVSHNTVPAEDLPSLIAKVHDALLSVSANNPKLSSEKQPAVPVKESVTPSHIVCLECGERFRMLKRHLASDHGVTPHEYRNRWGLPSNYPIIAPEYSVVRSGLAKQIGLGRDGGRKAQ